MRIGSGSIIQLGYGRYQKRIEATITENTSCISVDISCDKVITKELSARRAYRSRRAVWPIVRNPPWRWPMTLATRWW